MPAEELLEIGYRRELKAQGKIKYMGGKSEFLRRGYFDGVDIAFMVHTASVTSIGSGAVGCIAKNIIYKGKAAHAGGSPERGVNALYAANCGINAVNALRETFREADQIRVHPIMTAGGDMVNAIPATARLESYVRGVSYDAILAANRRVNRALVSAALSLGANVEIVDIPGYAPLVNDKNMIDLAAEALSLALPGRSLAKYQKYSTGSTDMGDLSCIMPVIHPYCPGACGQSHGSNYGIVDPVLACVENAKWQLNLLYLLLGNGAENARRVIAGYQPLFADTAAYLAYADGIRTRGERISYTDGGATVRL